MTVDSISSSFYLPRTSQNWFILNFSRGKSPVKSFFLSDVLSDMTLPALLLIHAFTLTYENTNMRMLY